MRHSVSNGDWVCSVPWPAAEFRSPVVVKGILDF